MGGDHEGTRLGYHKNAKGGGNIDFGNGATKQAKKRSPGMILVIHLVCMIIAWGALLPFGAIVANRMRNVSGSPPGAWFELHKSIQRIGYVFQLCGFGMAVWYVNLHGVRFANYHTQIGLFVSVVATLQPLNAALRPHPNPNGPKSWARFTFEIIHKGLGWTAIFL